MAGTDTNDRYYKVGCYINKSRVLEGCVNTKHHHELMQEVSCIKGVNDIDTDGYEKKECCLVRGTFPYNKDTFTSEQCETMSKHMSSEISKGQKNDPCEAMSELKLHEAGMASLRSILEFATLY